MFLSHHFNMEHSSSRRQHKRLRDFLAILTLSGLTAGCEAKAQNSEVIAAPEVTQVTVQDCASIKAQEKMIDYFQKLKTQQDAEIAARTERIKSKQVENDDKRKLLEAERIIAAELNADIEVLSKEAAEAMEQLEDRVLEPER